MARELANPAAGNGIIFHFVRITRAYGLLAPLTNTHTHSQIHTHTHTLNLRISRARATAAGSLSYLAARARQIEHSSRGARAWSHDALAHTHIRQATEPHIRVRRGVFLIKTPGKHIIIYGAWCPGRIR